MKLEEIKNKAKKLNIDPGKMKKPELIHAIQAAEGFAPCYGKSNGNCKEFDCCFRDDCLKIQ